VGTDQEQAPVSIDHADKKRRIESLRDEVRELHTLLKQVLPKLNSVTSVEYTHGPSERGADFVVHKHDDTLNQTTYIGVIAKIGAIKADHSDVARQIEECISLERHILGGKRRIHLNEVWVLTTGHISENAKERIYAKYKSLNISFISGEKLIELIDRTAPHFWLDVSVEVGHYLARLLVRMSDLDAQTNLLRLNGKGRFIEADVIERDTSEYQQAPQRNRSRANLKREILHRKITVLEGGMGSGKSHLMRHLVSHFATVEVYRKVGWVPVYTDWKTLADKHKGLVDSLITFELGTLAGSIGEDAKKFLIFVDGVDELLPGHGAYLENGATSSAFDGSLALVERVKSMPHVKLVLATRPMASVAALARSQSTGHYEILPLSLKKIIGFVSEICKELNLSKRLLEDLKRSELFRQLPHTPIAAILLSKLLTENQRELPSNLTELYAQSLEQMLGRLDVSKGLSTQKEYEACEQSCFRLAIFLLDNNLPQISQEEAKDIANTYLGERNLDLKSDALFEYLTGRSGVLSLDRERGMVGFRHRSFAEFMYAKAKRTGEGLRIDHRAFQLYWSHVYFFYVGLWKDCPSLLGELLSTTPQDEGQRWLKMINMPSYLLAAFSSPYEVVEQNLYKLYIEAACLYEDVLQGRSSTKLSSLPEMHLLWVMQMLIREYYSYSFFAKAIDNVRLQIEDDISLKPETRAMAQFLVAVTAMDLGEKKPFDFLLERNGPGELPLSISYAVLQESKSIEDRFHSSLLRRRNKKLRQLLAQNRGLSQQMKNKFEASISSVLGK
jgi:hypothetical protein